MRSVRGTETYEVHADGANVTLGVCVVLNINTGER